MLTIRAGVSKRPLSGTESVFLKLKKESFGLKNYIFICFANCVPYNSQVLGASCIFFIYFFILLSVDENFATGDDL